MWQLPKNNRSINSAPNSPEHEYNIELLRTDISEAPSDSVCERNKKAVSRYGSECWTLQLRRAQQGGLWLGHERIFEAVKRLHQLVCTASAYKSPCFSIQISLYHSSILQAQLLAVR